MLHKFYAHLAGQSWWGSYRATPASRDSVYFTTLLIRKAAGLQPVASAPAPWWQERPFPGSIMARSLLSARLQLGGPDRPVLAIGTVHLESPCYLQQKKRMEFFSEARRVADLPCLGTPAAGGTSSGRT